MNIAFYSTYILEYGGGFEKYLIETAAQLAAQPGVTADVITMDDAWMIRTNNLQSRIMGQKIDKGINYKESTEDIKRRLGKAGYHKVHTFKQLRRTLQNYDVIYCKNELREGFILKFLLRYGKLPPVVFGGHTPLKYPEPLSLSGKLRNALYNGRAYKLLGSGAAKFHAINAAEAELYQKLFPKKEVIKIHNPFDITRFKANADQHQFKLKADASTINIMWVGRLTEQKGVRDLADIVLAVNQNVNKNAEAKTKIAWHIFGDGDQKDIVLALADSEPNVHYYGHVDQKTMAHIYSQNHILLSTSKWEGYPYTLIEPQAFGLQLFAYDIPGPRDIFAEYDGGHLAGNKAEMINLLTDAITTYKTAHGAPRSSPSNQFDPQTIYQKLQTMLQIS